jgi:CheY-like chemotaxis protein
LSLTGNLEDLPLLDIIQIVSFSKKTGYLSIEMDRGAGGIVFRDGLVVCAVTPGSPPVDRRVDQLPAAKRDQLIRSRIGFALEQLARLREGAFAFELTAEVPATLGSRDISGETMSGGIDPQDLLLDLAAGMDEGQAESAAAVEASFAAPEEALVHDEASAPIVPATALDSEREALAGEPLAVAPAPSTASHDPDASSPLAGLAAEVTAEAPPPQPAPAPEPPRDEAAAPPAPKTPAASEEAEQEEAEAPRVLLLVDDEADVREILRGHFATAGYRVEEAGDPEMAAKLAGRLRAEDTPFVLVTDLGMPASGGTSFHGGFEVVKRLWKMNLRPPILMMTESLSQSLRLRARQMGIQAFVFKPTLSKLNRRQFEADLAAFAAKLAEDVLPRLAEVASLRPPPRKRPGAATASRGGGGDSAGPPAEDATRPFEFLRRRLGDLRQPGDANQIAALVMRVAREFFERAILFVVKNDQARGLGGFGLAPRDETLNLLARQVSIPLSEPSLFQEAVHTCRSFKGPPPEDRWAGHLMGRIGRFQSGEIALLPLLAHRQTIALLFGDNPETGRPVAGLDALEVFVHQAGLSLENVFLQRKLQSLQGGDPSG